MDKLISWLNEQRGRRTELATKLGCGPNAISQWEQVPVRRVLEVSRITGIPRHELRPDMYPAKQEKGVAA